MGLDQYIYRLSKVGKDTIKKLNGMNEDDIDWHDYMIVSKETMDKYPNCYSDILDILRPIQVKNTLIDIDRMEKDYHVDGLRCRGTIMSYKGIVYEYVKKTPDGNHETISISLSEEQLKKYRYEKTVDSYICRRKEVYYMRKEYEVQDSIYELYDGAIENCGYHHMSEDMIHAVNECAGKKVLDPAATNLFYYEWY